MRDRRPASALALLSRTASALALLSLLVPSAGYVLGLAPGSDGRSFCAGEPPVLVDLRPTAEFEAKHLAGACSLPLDSLRERMFELPPPGEWPLSLIGDESDLAAAREILEPRGWQPLSLDAADADTWADRELTSGASTAQSWRPNSFLAAVLRAVELPSDGGAAVDVGCGSGRDAVALAQRLGGSWRVYGVDNHEAALERARALARSSGAQVDFRNVELRKAGPGALPDLAAGPPAQPLRLVHGCRFLHRPLLEALPSQLAPGGLVVYSHFEDPLDGPPPAPPFRRGRRLERGELRAMLGEEQGFEVLCDESGVLLTRGVWTPASFYAARLRG